jgi:hypothetical protein
MASRRGTFAPERPRHAVSRARRHRRHERARRAGAGGFSQRAVDTAARRTSDSGVCLAGEETARSAEERLVSRADLRPALGSLIA